MPAGVAAKAPPSACDGGPAHSAAGQDRVAGATDAHPGMRVAPGVAKQYRPVCKAAVSLFTRDRYGHHLQQPAANSTLWSSGGLVVAEGSWDKLQEGVRAGAYVLAG